jgi:hypothetical protein
MIHLKCRLDRRTYCLDYVGRFERVCYHIRQAWWAVTKGYTYMRDDSGFYLTDDQAHDMALSLYNEVLNNRRKDESK